MKRSRVETETTIVFNEGEDEAVIFTMSDRVKKRLEKMGFKGDTRGTRESKWFNVPKSLIIFRGYTKKPLSNEQKVKQAEIMKKAREHTSQFKSKQDVVA